jgi:hypothetical protein
VKSLQIDVTPAHRLHRRVFGWARRLIEVPRPGLLPIREATSDSSSVMSLQGSLICCFLRTIGICYAGGHRRSVMIANAIRNNTEPPGFRPRRSPRYRQPV